MNTAKGFTLTELLITVGVIAMIGGGTALAFDPAEIMRQTRDEQRMADLNIMKSAITQYLKQIPKANLTYEPSGYGFHDVCFNGTSFAQILYSAPHANVGCAWGVDDVLEGTDANGKFNGNFYCRYDSSGSNINGTGWVPVNFTLIPGGSPIKSLPVDPINNIGEFVSPNSKDYAYRYSCQGVSADSKQLANIFEFNAVLESKKNKSLMARDGGDNPHYYEVGTSLRLLGNSTKF